MTLPNDPDRLAEVRDIAGEAQPEGALDRSETDLFDLVVSLGYRAGLAQTSGEEPDPADPRIALVRCSFEGKPAAAIAVVAPDPNDADGFLIEPMALLMTDSLFARMEAPSDAE